MKKVNENKETDIKYTMASTTTDLALDREIDYQFACRYVALLEKIFDRYKKTEEFYEHSVLWETLTQNIANISSEYRSRHPEKPWGISRCYMSIGRCRLNSDNPTTLAEIETEIKRIDERIDEMNKVPLCECPECDDDYLNDYLNEQKHWYRITSTSIKFTLDFLEKYWDKPWHLYYLAANMMPAAKAQFKKEYLAALKIQEVYLQAKFNPVYAYCRRLHSEFYQSLLCA